MQTKILYGVQGEGRGHATRSMEVISLLREKNYDVHILTGGDAKVFFSSKGFPFTTINSFRYQYNKKGSLSLFKTGLDNLMPMMGLFFGMGSKFKHAKNVMMNLNPKLVISDFEPYTCRMAGIFKIPLLSINHQHFFTECRIPKQSKLSKAVLVLIFKFSTRLLTGKPNRMIASSFYHFPKLPKSKAMLVGPIITKELKELHVTFQNHVVVYFKKPEYAYKLLPLFSRIPKTCWDVFVDFGTSAHLKLNATHIQYHKIDRELFLNKLASCRGMITTAGNQVLGEAIYLGKPILAFPEPEVVEQELNAQALVLSGAGTSYPLEKINVELLKRFLRKAPSCTNIPRKTYKPLYDGSHVVLGGIEAMLQSI